MTKGLTQGAGERQEELGISSIHASASNQETRLLEFPELRRWFYGFRSHQSKKFEEKPYYFEMNPEDSQDVNRFVITDYIEEIKENSAKTGREIENLIASGATPITADNLKHKVMNMVSSAPAKKVEFWTFKDRANRHLLTSMFGGTAGNPYSIFNGTGIEKFLPRDLVHLRHRLNDPELIESVEKTAVPGFAAAYRGHFNHLRKLAHKTENMPPMVPEDPTLKEGDKLFFYDLEFYNPNKFTCYPISIGMVSHDKSREYYAVIKDYIDLIPPDHWLQKNVLPHLDIEKSEWKSLEQVGPEILNFVGPANLVDFWSFHDDHDRYLLFNILSKNSENLRDVLQEAQIEKILARDIVHLCDKFGNPRLPIEFAGNGDHNALNDAHRHKEIHDYVRAKIQRKQLTPDIAKDFQLRPQ